MTNTDLLPAQDIETLNALNRVRYIALCEGHGRRSIRWTPDRFAQDRIEEDFYPTGRRRLTPTAA